MFSILTHVMKPVHETNSEPGVPVSGSGRIMPKYWRRLIPKSGICRCQLKPGRANTTVYQRSTSPKRILTTETVTSIPWSQENSKKFRTTSMLKAVLEKSISPTQFTYSPVILWKKIGQPATNCNRRFFNGFRLCNVSLLTYQKSQKIPLREVTKKRDLLWSSETRFMSPWERGWPKLFSYKARE